MKLNIELIDNLEHDCYNGLLASVAKWNKKEYELAYAESWDFIVKYEIKGENTFGYLDSPNTLNHDLLKSYTGISANCTGFNKNKEDFMTKLKSEFARQQPVIILLDYYWCPWNKEVSKITHMPHASLVVGFDELGLNCLDYSPRYDKCTLPYENIINIDECFTIDIDNPTYDNNYDDLLIRSTNIIESHDIFNAMRKFGDYIEESFDPVKYLNEVENDAWLPNIFQISLITESRGLYSETLRTISVKNKMESLIAIAERLESVKPMWTVVKSLFTKAYYTKDSSFRKRIAQQIYKIADYEEDIYSSLVSIIK